MLENDSKFIMRNQTQKAALIDAVAVAPEVYSHAFKKKKIQDSFVAVGEVTNYGTKEEPKYLACPDLLAMRKNCKITWTNELWNRCSEKLHDAVTAIRKNGYISEEWFDENDIPKDTRLNGEEIARDYSLQQMHMQRHVILNHERIESYFNDVQEQKRMKKQRALEAKYHHGRQLIKIAAEAQSELEAMVTTTNQDGSKTVQWEDLQLRHMVKIKAASLEAFYIVRKTTDVTSTLPEVAKTKGDVEKVVNEVVAEGKLSRYNLKRAYDVRCLPVIANDPGPTPQVPLESATIPPPVRITFEDNSPEKFNVTPELVREACANFSSLADAGDTAVNLHLNNIEKLDPEMLAKTLMFRLPRNLKERRVKSMEHVIWNDFVLRNSRLCAFVMKLHGVAMNDEALAQKGFQHSLFSNSFINNTECLSGRPDAVLDDVADELGAYLFEDEDGIGICRAGSASVGLRKRYKGHEEDAKQKTSSGMKSYLYTCFSNTEDGKRGSYGRFKDLKQITGVRYKVENKQKVVDMFEWSDDILKFLEPKDGSMIEKKNRMVCYLFEKMFDLMIGNDLNLSKNPGFEKFIGIW